MDLLTVVLLLAAALLHSSWHAMIKVSDDRLIGLAGMNVVSAAASLCALPFVAVPGHAVCAVLGISVVLHNAYKIGLTYVYRHGELGEAYPIARGFSPIFACLIALVALHEIPSFWQASGIALVSAGIFAIGRARRAGKTNPALLIAAAVTGLMVASYTVVDAYGTRLHGDWFSFVLWLMVLDGLAFVGVASAVRGRSLWITIATQWRTTLVSGLLGIGAFGVFVWALSRGPIGGVAALRETSVLFASIIGLALLKERWSPGKFAGVALITIGIIVFATRA
jgi:drug/metabolite transporter (DMT)-like permease